MEQEYVEPPLIVSVFLVVFFLAIVYAIFLGIYKLIKYYVDSFTNKTYYNRNLLVLASKIIKADGVVNKEEQDFVRKYFINKYGKNKANRAFRQLKEVTLDKVSTEETCKKVYDLLTYNERFKFVEFLFSIAYSSGTITTEEELEIRKIASYLHLSRKDYTYLRSIFIKSNQKKTTVNYRKSYDYIYETLGLKESASDFEIKKAYRNLVKQFHPDRLENPTNEDVKVAKEKFQEIQNAYQKIKKQRGIS